MLVFMKTTRVSSEDNAKSNDSDHIFVFRENIRLKQRCLYTILKFKDNGV